MGLSNPLFQGTNARDLINGDEMTQLWMRAFVVISFLYMSLFPTAGLRMIC